MGAEGVLIDTGPLVALLNRSDQWHEWARDRAMRFDAPVLSCEAVLSEAHFLLQRVPNGSHRLNELVDSGRIEFPFSYGEEIGRVNELIETYDDVPMSFADACLVRMSEVHSGSEVCTLDDDFSIYRQFGQEPIPLIAP